MAINYITTANTFQQWLISTQDLITTANSLTDNVGGTFYANTNLVVGNTLNVVGNTTIASANITTLIGTANTGIYNRIVEAENNALAFSIALG